MSTPFKHARILAVSLAGFALVAAGLGAGPAQAVVVQPVTTVHIQNAQNEPLSGLDVQALSGDRAGDFAETSTPGDYEANGALYPGDWTLYVSDSDQNHPQPYIADSEDFTVNGASDGQVLPTITLTLGAIVKGKVTAPSGRVLKNFQVESILNGARFTAADTDSTGNFTLKWLPAGTYKFGYFSSWGSSESTAKFTTSSFPALTVTAGEISTAKVNLKKVKAPPALDVRGKSSAKRKATLKVAVNATLYGIKSPGGTITIKEGKKTLKSKVKVKANGAFSTINLNKLKKGKHTFTVFYSGGQDVNKDHVKFTLQVK